MLLAHLGEVLECADDLEGHRLAMKQTGSTKLRIELICVMAAGLPIIARTVTLIDLGQSHSSLIGLLLP